MYNLFFAEAKLGRVFSVFVYDVSKNGNQIASF